MSPSLYIILLALSLWLICYIAHRIITPIVLHIVDTTSTKLDDYFLNRPVLHALWNLIATLLFNFTLPILADYIKVSEHTLLYAERASNALISLGSTLLIVAFLDNLASYTAQHNPRRSHHVISILQFLKILILLLGAIATIALVLGRNPLGLMAGLGAAATILLFVFRDTILGLVAGIQLSAYNMLKPGDWVTLPKHNIDGVVLQVSLATVKIRNFDHSISTIPPYTLIIESFQNWDNMKVHGARRVKRSLLIDVNSIRRLTENEVASIADETNWKDESSAQINLTCYRHYVAHLLRSHPLVARPEDEWILVRQLEAGPHGLPLEIWFYLRETEFVRFEGLAADIIEQLIAALPLFGLRLFQNPSGSDVTALTSSYRNAE